jgi:hypothetical protein
LHAPELHVCSSDAAASPVAVHMPLAQVCLHEESSWQSSVHAPDPQTRLQIEPLSHLALQSSLPLHVKAHVPPAVHKQLCDAEHVSAVGTTAAS